MLAVGLARAAAEAGYRTYFTTAADLAARCHRAAIEGRWATTMRFFAGPTLLVIDELGYLPLPAEAASALFQVITQRYLKTSIVLTTNRGVGSWGEILGDTTVAAAMLDRLLHRSVVLNLDGDSYRLRDHHARTDTLRRATTGTRQPLPDHRHRVGNFGEQLWPRSLSAITGAGLMRMALLDDSRTTIQSPTCRDPRHVTCLAPDPARGWPGRASFRGETPLGWMFESGGVRAVGEPLGDCLDVAFGRLDGE